MNYPPTTPSAPKRTKRQWRRGELALFLTPALVLLLAWGAQRFPKHRITAPVSRRGTLPKGFVPFNPATTFLSEGSLCVDFSPDGKTLANGGVSRTAIIDVTKHPWCEMRSVHQYSWLYAVAFSPDGKTLASGGDGFQAQLLDPKTGRGKGTVSAHSRVKSLAFSPDGKWLADLKALAR